MQATAPRPRLKTRIRMQGVEFVDFAAEHLGSAHEPCSYRPQAHHQGSLRIRAVVRVHVRIRMFFEMPTGCTDKMLLVIQTLHLLSG